MCCSWKPGRISIRGRCPVPELIDAGVTVALGSDGAAPDRGYDMFRHMFQCMHYHRRHFRDAGVLPHGKVLEMVTIDAARALSLDHEIGSLEPGRLADVCVWDWAVGPVAQRRLEVARDLHEKVFAWMLLGDERNLAAAYVAGSRVQP